MRTPATRLRTTGVGALTAMLLTLGTGVAQAGEPEAVTPQGSILGAEAPGAVEGRYIVALEGRPSLQANARATVRSEARELASAFGGTVEHVYSAAFRGFALTATEAQARKLAADPDVRYVEADGVARISGEQANPPSWGLDRVDGTRDSRYVYPNEGAGVTAYVLDTGVDLRHPSFEGRAKSGYDFIDNDDDASDCQGHGTHVAGTVGSKEYGVAKGVDIVSVRVLNCQGSGEWSQIIAGIDWVAQNADGPSIGNMSLGGGANSSVDQALQGAIGRGVQFAVAAGNESANACNTSPARVPAAITLGSTDSNDGRSSFSNFGSCLDLFAPGGNITSTRNGGGSHALSGTSMATPHAAGAAALHLSSNPGATPQQVRDALVQAAQSGVVGNPGSGSPNLLLNVTGLGTAPDQGAPVAAFTAECGQEEPSCSFDATGSRDEDGTIASYGWTFGDGTTGTGVNPSHTYAERGSYQVTLTVTDNDGKTDSLTRTVSAGVSGEAPQAAFTATCWYESCDFDASQTRDPDGDIASYAWKFGDGTTGTGITATHAYPAAQQNYTAELTVTDRAGNTGTTTRTIQCWNLTGNAFCFAV